jgi:hypothetical protein
MYTHVLHVSELAKSSLKTLTHKHACTCIYMHIHAILTNTIRFICMYCMKIHALHVYVFVCIAYVFACIPCIFSTKSVGCINTCNSCIYMQIHTKMHANTYQIPALFLRLHAACIVFLMFVLHVFVCICVHNCNKYMMMKTNTCRYIIDGICIYMYVSVCMVCICAYMRVCSVNTIMPLAMCTVCIGMYCMYCVYMLVYVCMSVYECIGMHMFVCMYMHV